MIRRATPDDAARIVEMGLRFLSVSEYAAFFEGRPEPLASTLARLMDSDDGAVFVLESGSQLGGMIAMAAYQHPFSGERVASEIAWWVEPESRGGTGALRLLMAGEGWARDGGASAVQMVAPNESVGHLYERLGYRLMETAYQRRL